MMSRWADARFQTTCGEQIAMFVASSLTCSCADAATTFLPSDHAKTAASGACIKDDAIVRFSTTRKNGLD